MKWLNSIPFPVIAAIALFLSFMPLPAHAEPYTYAPEHCEFTITFPSEPLIGRKCNPDKPEQCHEIVSFTKVFDVTATLQISVVCNPAEENMYERYSGDVMKTTLIAMAGRGKLEEYETGYNEYPAAKVAYILGYGKKEDQDLIYNGQLWIGKKSVFSLEADIVGNEVAGADEMFATILKSVHLKDQSSAPATKTEESPAAEEKKDEKPTENPPKE